MDSITVAVIALAVVLLIAGYAWFLYQDSQRNWFDDEWDEEGRAS